MHLLPKTLTLYYTGRRAHQLRADRPRRSTRFLPNDYLLDDLKALRITIADFVNVSPDGRTVEYTWIADSDPIRAKVRLTYVAQVPAAHHILQNLARRIEADVECASRNRRVLDRLNM